MKFLLALVLLVPASGVGAGAKPLQAHQEPRGIGNLVVPGDRVQVVYAVDTQGVRGATGTLFVRNDRMRAFARVRLHKLAATLPQRLLRGRRLTYYAVIREPRTHRSVRLPRRTAWILEKPLRVDLGAHRFGQARAPDARVAHWAASDVGWQDGGDPYGPETFLVGQDGAVWLDDEVNNRLLVARPGDESRTVPLPIGTDDGDLALGPDGTVYSAGIEGVGLDAHMVLYRLSPSGEVLWKANLNGELREGSTFLLGVNSPLRLGPDGTLYSLVGMVGLPGGEPGWMPVATPAGTPVPFAAQRARTSWPSRPVGKGVRLVSEVKLRGDKAPREVRFALLRGDRVVRSWRVVSKTDLNFDYFTPELVGGDLVVQLDVTRQATSGFQWEYEILRLGPRGLKSSFSLPRAVYGDNLLTDLRIGPDGSLYQLASSPQTGVTILRYSLG